MEGAISTNCNSNKVEMNNCFNVIIIGAGMAGISAASHLIKHGETNIKLLEARNRIGGRIISIPMGNTHVELGAKWIHGIMGNPIYELAIMNKLIQLTNDQHPHTVVATTEEGKRVPIAVVEEVYSAYFWFSKRCEEYFLLRIHPPSEVSNSVGKHLEMDIKAFLDQYEGEDCRIRRMVFNHLLSRETCITGCHSMDETGLNDFGSYTELPGGNVSLPKSYFSLLECLTKDLPKDSILKGLPVKCIRWGPNHKSEALNCLLDQKSSECNNPASNIQEVFKIEVEAVNGQKFYSKHVIVTLPLGVLKATAEDIFDPPLPDYKREAIKNLCFGVVDKIYLEYEQPFLNPEIAEVITLWDETTEQDISKTWYRKIYSFSKITETVLLAWVSGKEAEYLETLSSDQVGEACTMILRKFLNDTYIPKPIRVVCTSWKNQPYTCGSYTSIGVNSTQRDIELLGTPLYSDPDYAKPALLFAGEATHPSFYSTVHGAYLSGRQAAEYLVETKQTNSLPAWSIDRPRCSVGDLSSWLKGIDLT
ncbi:peroxisomal N(1)-acetyl-spermine/spermidine oxidase-like isoform X1 [Limulus polyphemus]|uniref:Peroxisomal N(1)-acetyl-spermine/spermidine oxidase-like isoform X1 n=1 Tax=Limulus polyphemus TaxID=6850 RepID=A0ABM1TGE5_LIMPO|nr:peroxisomal N(1)-acetyl-spermine/spermidine oxidase-like isoform X1 [Limulus polyphemus]XP_022254951.1 peroxisomal N(1)-acetyl-spermine/spermidine oxidase-like isoform X1 [Limulus polyphemus]